jgi:hypothetical protein
MNQVGKDQKMALGVNMPISAQATGKRRCARVASAPINASRLISSPTVKRTAPSAHR